ncbi:MAG: retropepsin-like domain-containing protein [Chryseobacterium sp.]|jgi:hypothetical protein|uniref:aspartyl protease family protein n=1 Tax=Chryseobacterium sp. TaxID=1871047 RepID=UPI002837EDA6|nr:aspartyl protease family protein [Chryseobacterium sp.]MDR2234659.1 retropepsin-like domain-containing protein [Chryseobacterium sp.]
MNNQYKFCCIIFLFFFSLSFKAVTIPFELIDGKIIVGVTIKNEPHHFIFDSGAFTIISSELKNKLNEKKSQIVFEGVDANSVKAKMDVFSTDLLQIGNQNLNNINFSFADISWMKARACRKISGIFGANMMKGKVWRIDFKTNTMTMSDQALEQAAGSVSVPFSEENFTGVPRIHASIRKQKIEFIFDTGSGMGITMNQKSYNAVKDDRFLTFEGLLSQSLNSTSKGERQVDVMDMEISGVNTGGQIIDSSPDASNLIGIRMIENYLVDLDFINKKIVLSAQVKTPEYPSFGVAFAPVNGHLVIVNKLKIPQLAGLHLADRIIKINSRDVSNMSDEAFCDIKNVLNNSETITIETDSHKTLTLEKKNVLQYLD